MDVSAAQKYGLALIDQAIELWKPVSAVVALYSGGHDSFCSTHIASLHPRFSGVAHVNTGIGVEETRIHVRETCASRGWPLTEYHPPMTYKDIVLRWGFPGPGGHDLIYQRLKERCVRKLVKEHKTKRSDRVLLVTGCRSQESVRRMGHVEPIQKEKGAARVWVAPIHAWTGLDKNDYIDAVGHKRNEVVELLCMSGECLCGAFAKPNEIKIIEQCYPEAARQIHALEVIAQEAGVHCVWGTRPPKKVRCEKKPRPGVGLCFSCENK